MNKEISYITSVRIFGNMWWFVFISEFIGTCAFECEQIWCCAWGSQCFVDSNREFEFPNQPIQRSCYLFSWKRLVFVCIFMSNCVRTEDWWLVFLNIIFWFPFFLSKCSFFLCSNCFSRQNSLYFLHMPWFEIL